MERPLLITTRSMFSHLFEFLSSSIYVVCVFCDQFGSLLSIYGCYHEVGGDISEELDRSRPRQVVALGAIFFRSHTMKNPKNKNENVSRI